MVEQIFAGLHFSFYLYLVVLPAVSLEVEEGEPGVCPGGGDGQFQGQLIQSNVHLHQVDDGNVQVDSVMWWRICAISTL